MNLLSNQMPLLSDLSCTCLDRAPLILQEDKIWCKKCGNHSNLSDTGILDLLDKDQLEKDAARELEEHTRDWSESDINQWVLYE